ncbi:hypothetical protein D1159_07900 [Pseudoflavonifractor sp. 524-17]|uniref:hypothetical protein n=1 Tax=Pseudoflavonifractor sp. 524-17 TaxID=2304577 RepID=UPI0013798053|nr:hypothetical protein [Pseudoflavonifractor sp. 524-17]NCE64508.1 hypothetical protein [Pseudoflavonifractor sp. 524-17]
MVTSCKLILTAPPADCRAAQAAGFPVAHLAYRVGGGPHLFRSKLPVAARGGLMAMDHQGFDGRGEPSAFCQEVLRECSARGFSGVCCLFEGRPLPLLQQVAAQLGELLQRRGWPLYVPEAYGASAPHALVLISSALSGGSLRQRLTDAAQKFGAGRLALYVERVAEDFYLPSPTGRGAPLSRTELAERLEQLSPSVYFSKDLCARYFTYMAKENGAHFVLFDDAGSIAKKLQLAGSLGVGHALLSYSEADDLLPDLAKLLAQKSTPDSNPRPGANGV